MHLLKCLHHAQVFQKHKKLIEQTGIAEFMHLFNCFPRIQSLRDLCIISPRHLPVESFLHDAYFFGCLGDFWLALHAVVPLRFFLSLPLSPLPHNPLDQNVSGVSAYDAQMHTWVTPGARWPGVAQAVTKCKVPGDRRSLFSSAYFLSSQSSVSGESSPATIPARSHPPPQSRPSLGA